MYKVAVIGAAGLIGQEIITILDEKDFPIEILYPLTSKHQSGKEISFGEQDLKTIDKDGFDFTAVDFVFYATETIPSKDDVKKILAVGPKVIDCHGLMLFEESSGACISLSNYKTQALLKTLTPLNAQSKLSHLHVTVLEATSSAGKIGMDELFNQSRKFFVTDAMESSVFEKQIAFNAIPHIGDFMDDGQTYAEWQVAAELKKQLSKDIKISVTCVQVPTFIGSALSVTASFVDDMEARQAKSLWREQEDIMIIDRESEMEYVTPVDIAGEDAVFISRVRNDMIADAALSYWCVVDNIRSIALEAVTSAENLIQAA